MAKVKLTPAFLDRLRGLAQNCQPPIWEVNEHSDVVSVAHTVAEVAYDEDAQFIAAADPATVLALVEEIERLQEQNCQFRLKLYIEELVGKPESEAGQ